MRTFCVNRKSLKSFTFNSWKMDREQISIRENLVFYRQAQLYKGGKSMNCTLRLIFCTHSWNLNIKCQAQGKGSPSSYQTPQGFLELLLFQENERESKSI